MTQIALSLPRLELLRTEVRALGPDTWRVRSRWPTAAGCRPTSASVRCERKTVRGVMFEIHLPDGPAIAWSAASSASKARSSKAMRRRRSLQAFLPNREITADRAVAEWVVRAPQGTRLALSARADRAGVVRTEVRLD